MIFKRGMRALFTPSKKLTRNAAEGACFIFFSQSLSTCGTKTKGRRIVEILRPFLVFGSSSEGSFAVLEIYGGTANGVVVAFTGDTQFTRDKFDHVLGVDEVRIVTAELRAKHELPVFFRHGKDLYVFGNVERSRSDLRRFFDHDRLAERRLYRLNVGRSVCDLHADLIVRPADIVEFRCRLIRLDGAQTVGENGIERGADHLARNLLRDLEIHKFAKARRSDGKRYGKDGLRMRVEALRIPDRKLGAQESGFDRTVQIQMRNEFETSRFREFNSYFLRPGQHERSPPN